MSRRVRRARRSIFRRRVRGERGLEREKEKSEERARSSSSILICFLGVWVPDIRL
jgi:hypothetical protein